MGAMTGEDGKTLGIEKFDGTDFGYWKMQIEDYLYGKKLHLHLLGKKPDKMDDMFSTMIKLVKAERSLIEDYVWYRFAIGAHKYEKKKKK
jgi:hypothetical protein